MAGLSSNFTPRIWVGAPDATHPFLNTRFLDPKSNIRPEDLQRPIFKYDRNLTSGSEIRVLRIKPAQHFSDNLDCNIEYCFLDENPDFEALSYTWGSPFDRRHPNRRKYPDADHYPGRPPQSYPLFISGFLFWIGESLDSALRHIRGHPQYENADLVLWVDAVCIDQNDEAEKTWQVQQMRRVYSQASTVIIWLGPSDEGSDKAMHTLQAMTNFTQRAKPFRNAQSSMVNMPAPGNNKEFEEQLTAASFGKMFGKVTLSDREIPDFPIEEVAKLMSRAWWGRIWVLQELAVARRVTFVCGSKVMDGNGDDVFGTFLKTWDNLVKEFGRPARMVDHRPWTMLYTRLTLRQLNEVLEKKSDPTVGLRYHSGDPVSEDDATNFLQLLQEQLSLKGLLIDAAQASLQTTNSHDRIYALLGLASDSGELGIDLDYSMSHFAVFALVAAVYLNKRDLWFLSYCDQDPSSIPSHFRSWIPDWSRAYGYATLASHKAHRRWNASKDQSASVQYIFGAEGELPRLKLGGVNIDTVQWVSEIRPAASQNDLHPEARAAILSWVSKILSSHNTRKPTMRLGVLKSWLSRTLSGASHSAPVLSKFQEDVCWTLIAGLEPLPSEDQEKQPKDREVLVRQSLETLLGPDAVTDPVMQHRASCYFHQMMSVTAERRVFRTSGGRVGLGSQYIKPKDQIAIFLGAQTPFAIRQNPTNAEEKSYKLVGEVYVEGIMKGEFFEGNPSIEAFLLD